MVSELGDIAVTKLRIVDAQNHIQHVAVAPRMELRALRLEIARLIITAGSILAGRGVFAFGVSDIEIEARQFSRAQDRARSRRTRRHIINLRGNAGGGIGDGLQAGTLEQKLSAAIGQRVDRHFLGAPCGLTAWPSRGERHAAQHDIEAERKSANRLFGKGEMQAGKNIMLVGGVELGRKVGCFHAPIERIADGQRQKSRERPVNEDAMRIGRKGQGSRSVTQAKPIEAASASNLSYGQD